MNDHDRHASHFPWTSFIWPALFLLVLGAVLVWRFAPREEHSGLDPDAAARAVTARGDLAEDEKTTINIFREASPGVVHITSMTVQQSSLSLNPLQVPLGTGSGFVWDKDGHVVTNYHVIQGADAAQVTLADRSSYKARLAGAYPDKDLAVLYIDASKDRLHPIPVGTSHDLQVGQKTFVIGNPFGLDRSLTTGIVSALGREIESVTRRKIKDMIQTDAAINPGNSGGPLLDSAGRLIGVNTAIYSTSGSYSGIGFAIPVDEVNRVVPQLIREGQVSRPGLGIQIAPDQVAQQLKLKGVLVVDVLPNSPAAKAGIQPTRRDENNRLQLGDVIVAIDGKEVLSTNDLLNLLEQHKVGDTVRVTVQRESGEEQLQVTLWDTGKHAG
jgi:S1-C subfamily serine protease